MIKYRTIFLNFFKKIVRIRIRNSEFMVLDPDPGDKFINLLGIHWIRTLHTRKKGRQLFANLLVIYYVQLTPYVKKMGGAVFSFFSYSENC
jgi:hypothetical protein